MVGSGGVPERSSLEICGNDPIEIRLLNGPGEQYPAILGLSLGTKLVWYSSII